MDPDNVFHHNQNICPRPDPAARSRSGAPHDPSRRRRTARGAPGRVLAAPRAGCPRPADDLLKGVKGGRRRSHFATVPAGALAILFKAPADPKLQINDANSIVRSLLSSPWLALALVGAVLGYAHAQCRCSIPAGDTLVYTRRSVSNAKRRRWSTAVGRGGRQHGAAAEGFWVSEWRQAPTDQTRVVYDDTTLYVAFTCLAAPGTRGRRSSPATPRPAFEHASRSSSTRDTPTARSRASR